MNERTFESLNNTRDLGGITAADGRRIRPGRLIRSGRLGTGTEEDIITVGKIASAVVDFRSENERSETPDPEISGVDYYHIPIIDDLAAGVSRDKKSDEEAFMMLANDPEGAFGYMCRTYEEFVTSGTARRGYRKFLDILLEEREKAVLWHCTAGKDRAGFASVIVLEILGADRKAITDNYLRTNELIRDDIQNMIDMFFRMTGGESRLSEPALRNMFEAREEYLEAVYAKADDAYGSFRSFLTEGLKVTEAEIQKMRTMYLE